MRNRILDIRDDGFLRAIDTDATLEEIAGGYKFIEGPIWHPGEQHLIFSDIIGDTMHRWQADSGVSVYRCPSHMANGNIYDSEGRILTCEHATSRVTRTEPSGEITVMASHYQGKELNSPNDIVVKSDGNIYFTDPASGRNEPYGVARPQELEFQGVYRLDPNTGALTLLVDDFDKPNGLCFDREEKRLFINDTARQHIRVFDVSDDGTIANDRLWADLDGDEKGVADGMKVDSQGNLFCCGPAGVHVFSDEGDRGHLLGRILIPQQAANFTWGDPDLKSLFITASTALYRLRVNVAGRPLF